jgi:hypothetical protein
MALLELAVSGGFNLFSEGGKAGHGIASARASMLAHLLQCGLGNGAGHQATLLGDRKENSFAVPASS